MDREHGRQGMAKPRAAVNSEATGRATGRLAITELYSCSTLKVVIHLIYGPGRRLATEVGSVEDDGHGNVTQHDSDRNGHYPSKQQQSYSVEVDGLESTVHKTNPN